MGLDMQKAWGRKSMAYQGSKWFKVSRARGGGRSEEMGSGRRPEEMGGQEREWPLILNRRASLTEMRGNA